MILEFLKTLTFFDILNYIYMFFIIVCTVYCFVNTIGNAITFFAYKKKFSLTDEPSVDILIPARNEGKIIETTLTNILKQSYKNYKVYVIDDNSTDDTYQIMEKFKNDKKIDISKSSPLPKDWKGKQNALQQLLKKGSGEYIITIDADMVPKYNFIQYIMERVVMFKADMVSGWPKHFFGNDKTMWLMPIPYLMQFLFIPIWTMPWTLSSKMGFAAGGFIAYKREKLEKIGGYEVVKNIILEDVYMARTFKKNRFSVFFIDAKDYLQGDWFLNFSNAIRGFGRMSTNYFENRAVDIFFVNLYFFLHYSFLPVVLILNLIFLPPLWFIFLIAFFMIKFYWIFNILDRGFKFNWRFLFPEISFLFIIYVFSKSIILQKKGIGYKWKDRTVIN